MDRKAIPPLISRTNLYLYIWYICINIYFFCYLPFFALLWPASSFVLTYCSTVTIRFLSLLPSICFYNPVILFFKSGVRLRWTWRRPNNDNRSTAGGGWGGARSRSKWCDNLVSVVKDIPFREWQEAFTWTVSTTELLRSNVPVEAPVSMEVPVVDWMLCKETHYSGGLPFTALRLMSMCCSTAEQSVWSQHFPVGSSGDSPCFMIV